jgi:hypothetical protein
MDISEINNTYKDFQVSFNISEEVLSNLLCSAMMSITYWCQRVDTHHGGNYSIVSDIQHSDWSITIVDDEDGQEYTLVKADLHNGMQLMADEYPKHFLDVIRGNDDAITADVFIQCCVFKEVIYG